jgi:murein DD-endopeptidase MepM/ murein hydrolase activator NlpD
MQKNLVVLILLIVIGAPIAAFAETSLDIQKSIDAKNAEIQALQQEVNQYQNQVSEIKNQANSLQGTLKVIGNNQKQLQNNLSLTSKKTQKTELTIVQNQQEIGNLGRGISKNTQAISQNIRSLNQSDSRSVLELLASTKSVSEFIQDIDQMLDVQSSLQGHVDSMQLAKKNLERAQQSLDTRKQELQILAAQLKDQKKIVDVQANEKTQLLIETKNKESEYQKLLNDRKKQIEALTAEIFDYESKLKFTLNVKSLPKIGSGALSWPVENVTITQRFGKTVDARRLYVSGSHSGVDFRAAVGTPIYAAGDGIVEGIGDTDKTCPKASFGKWVFIRHTNGLATAYGHLSLIKAYEGQKVQAGDLIAYSGNTGHSTGPHLHLTVYASNGVDGEDGARVAERPSASCKGKNYRMPIAPTNAYLDPLLYLPKTTSAMYKDGGQSSSE